MEFQVHVKFTENVERHEILEGFEAWQQLGVLLPDDFTAADKDALERMAGRFGTKGVRAPFDRATVLEGRRCLRMLRTELDAQSKATADPSWIESNKRIEAEGGTPIVADPEQTVLMINETRLRRIRRLDRAQEILKVALDELDGLEVRARHATELVQELAG